VGVNYGGGGLGDAHTGVDVEIGVPQYPDDKTEAAAEHCEEDCPETCRLPAGPREHEGINAECPKEAEEEWIEMKIER